MSLRPPDWTSEDGSVQLYCADCLDILREMEPGSVDAVVTDIPYNISKEGNGLRTLDYGDWDKNFNHIPYIEYIIRVSNSFCVWCENEQVSDLVKIFRCVGISRVLCWVKPNPTVINGKCHWLPGVELCVAGKKYNEKFLLNCHKGWFLCPAPVFRLHPTEKPLEIIETQVSAYDGIILDPFMGSGTTGVACVRLGRKFIGVEIEPKYFEIARKRIQKAFDDQALFKGLEPEPKQQELFAAVG